MALFLLFCGTYNYVLSSREDTAFQRNDLTSKILDKINTNETAGNLTRGGGNEIHNTPPEILADIVLHNVGNSAPTPPLSVFTWIPLLWVLPLKDRF
ncbi:hypothetical protein TNIN_14771 [Trichonephila inaurata madagascariensis]|uniref:Uncharacterized protein n=1 Tax=Trichonephila inaurata madagascariensis TaxID=2747483 RepID=A0A8X7C289_9ARAC|nr:hypothetical protein TNIN_14771 [Trichonephila inaurata madagascariensis]